MNKFRLLVIAGVALLGLTLFAACGGDDDNGTIRVGDEEIPIGDDINGDFSEDLPDEFPDNFPVYDGADLQGSYRGESEGVEGIVATWTTGDSVDDVAGFYESELEGDDWSVETSGDAGGTGSFFFATSSDESQVAYVFISGEGDETTILVTIGDNDGSLTGDDGVDDGDDPVDDGSDDPSADDSGDDGSASGELPDEQELSDDFPTDRVPLPGDVRVTSTSSIASGGTTTHFVEFYSEQSADDLAGHFQDELPGNGWTETLVSETGGEKFLSFADESGDSTAGVLISIRESDVEGYQIVSLTVSTV